jgi:hypothetical protein
LRKKAHAQSRPHRATRRKLAPGRPVDLPAFLGDRPPALADRPPALVHISVRDLETMFDRLAEQVGSAFIAAKTLLAICEAAARNMSEIDCLQLSRLMTSTGHEIKLAISIPGGEARVIRHFQERMPYGLFVPDVP